MLILCLNQTVILANIFQFKIKELNLWLGLQEVMQPQLLLINKQCYLQIQDILYRLKNNCLHNGN